MKWVLLSGQGLDDSWLLHIDLQIEDVDKLKLIDAKNHVLDLIEADVRSHNLSIRIDRTSPGHDIGKFLLDNKPARVIAPFNGFYVNISKKWFGGSKDLPKISGNEFYWYVFALKRNANSAISDYYICDHNQMRQWVLEFDAPLGRDHREHNDWRGTIEIKDTGQSGVGYFRWGDEPSTSYRQSRYIQINNIASILPIKDFFTAPEEIETDEKHKEGAVRSITVNYYERDNSARKACIDHFGYDCKVCRVNFKEIYGEIGAEFIHVHHLVPLSEIGEQYEIDPVRDLIPVCPNCHAMLHKKKPPYSVDELKDMML